MGLSIWILTSFPGDCVASRSENRCLMPLLHPWDGEAPSSGPRLIPPLWPSLLQKLDPFLADLHQASSLLTASIKVFEKGDPPGGVQVSQEHGVGRPRHTPDSTDQGLSEGDIQLGMCHHPCF